MTLHEKIERLLACDSAELQLQQVEATEAFTALRSALNAGAIRAAERDGHSSTGWRVNAWVKQGILLGFRIGKLQVLESAEPWSFFDKHTLPVRRFTITDSVRMVPGGSSVRDGAFVAAGVIVMPPAYINIGAYVGAGTLVDSHALVGSCAQIGERVHLSAAAQIGGVLEPAGAMPVIIEDDVFVGGNTGVYEGCIVKHGAVLASGVILTGSTPIYDLVNSKVITKASGEESLIVPANAVVVPGSRSLSSRSTFASEYGLSTYAPIIVKYRDTKTSAAVALEAALR